MRSRLVALAVALSVTLWYGQAMASQIGITLTREPHNYFTGWAGFFINISGLGSGGVENLLGAWSMDVYYDDTVFMPTPGADWWWHLGPSLASVDISTPGVIKMSQVSLASEVELDSLQRNSDTGQLYDSFRLAELVFFAFSARETIMSTDNIVLSDAFGNAPFDSNGDPMPISNPPLNFTVAPEPGTIILFSVGLVGLVGLKYRSQRTREELSARS